MLEASVFNEDRMKKFLLQNYNLNVFQIEKLNRGSANLFSLNDKQYILKEYQTWYDEESIQRDTEDIHYLHDKKMPVPVLFPNVKNEFYTKYKNRFVLVEEYIEGEVRNSHTATLISLMDAAQVLGKLVIALEDIKISFPVTDVKKWFSKEGIQKSIQKYEDLLCMVPENCCSSQIKIDLKDKIEMLRNFDSYHIIDQLDKLTIKNTHGDYNVLQFIYQKDKIKAVVDFASVTKMPVVWEVIRSYSYMDQNTINGEFDCNHFKKYVQEFCKYVPLNKYDIQCMPYIYIAQLLHSDYGYKQYLNDFSQVSLLQFGFFRTKMCQYLFKNARQIVAFLEDA